MVLQVTENVYREEEGGGRESGVLWFSKCLERFVCRLGDVTSLCDEVTGNLGGKGFS